jgi:phosphoribosylaminoimidazole-succinocarboxamide synthase
MMREAVYETRCEGLKLLKRGKVRDMYDLGDSLLMVATDRLSAFDVVMPDPIPDKGKILTRISLFWFEVMQDLVDNHVITGDAAAFPASCRPYARQLAGRSIQVLKTRPLPIECVVRGYLSGSGWESYQRSGQVCGIQLPEGLTESDRLPEPIFTPSTKEDQGSHDVNIDFDRAADLVGASVARRVRDLSLALYRHGAVLAASKGIIIADTKFEFGLHDEKIILIDEILTPDSSRFWPRAAYEPGRPQQSFDKQYFRDYLTAIGFNKQPPGPQLPEHVIEQTRSRYLDALRLLTGSTHGLAD